VPHITRCFENAYNYHSRLFDYSSHEKITVLMQDFWDYGNAGASSVPNNRIIFGIAPLNYTFETSPANERVNHTMNHEIVHIVAMDKASANDQFFRDLFFGKVEVSADDPLSMLYGYLTNPRKFSPRWYHEGIAVFMETWMAGGIGRAMGSYDEMVFRTMVRDSSYFYSVIGLESEGTAIDFQVGANAYLYGTRFMSYLALQYGPKKLIDWISQTENRKKYFASDFERVYSNTLDEEWLKWIRWEHDFQISNLDAIRHFSCTSFRPISTRALGSVSRGFYAKEENKLLVAMLYPAQTAQITSIDLSSGDLKKICEVEGAGLYYVTSLAYNPRSEKLYFTTDNGGWRNLASVNIHTGEVTQLIDDARVGDLTLCKSDEVIWGIRHDAGISTIVRIPPPYDRWEQVYSWPYGNDMYDIDISPDGKILSGALARINGDQLLIKMPVDSLMAGNQTYSTLYNFENSLPANFSFSDDGRYLFGSSYYSGVSNIYRYDLQTDDIVALSNCESGFFRPVPVSSDSLIVFRYTGKGFIPAMIANQTVDRVSAINYLGNEIVKQHPVVKNWLADSPSNIGLDTLNLKEEDYSFSGNVKLNSIYPIIEGYKNTMTAGLRFDMSDWLGMAGLNGKLSYAPDPAIPADEKFHAALMFKYWNWKIKATYNQADFYDLFGPTMTSRKGYSLGVQYDHTFFYEKPRLFGLDIQLTGYTGLDRLPFFQNVTSPVEQFITLSASLNYQYLVKTLGAVEDEKGFEAELTTYNYYANKQLFPHLFANLNYGFLLPIDHSSLWLRSSFGISGGDREIAFANYYFGGFGNNWVDHQDVQRYRQWYSFPGVELNSISAQNFIRLMMEWPLPPFRLRRFGFTNVYLNWLRFSLFSSGLAEDIHNEQFSGYTADIGVQLDFKLVLFTYMSSTLSLGYATAFRENQPASNEWMISLKLL